MCERKCVCVRVCVCVCEGEREREKERECMCVSEREGVLVRGPWSHFVRGALLGRPRPRRLQGYLAHKKPPHPNTLQ